jgi:sugar lactone lactonase YvrE
LHTSLRLSSFVFLLAGVAPIASCTSERIGAVPAPATALAGSPNASGSSRVYVSDEKHNIVAVFNGDGKRVGTINSTGGLNYPQNLFVDGSGDLWVANEGGHDVLMFPPDSPYPTVTLADHKNLPADVTICPNGTIFVANIFSPSGGGDITVYNGVAEVAIHRTARQAIRKLTYAGSEFTGITCDAAGNVFATAVVGTFGSVVEFPRGREAHATQLPISSGGNLGGIKIDPAGNLLVDNPEGQVTEYTEAGQPTGVAIATNGWYGIALDAVGTTLYGADAGSEQGVAVTFPGGVQKRTFRGKDLSAVIGIAFAPAR